MNFQILLAALFFLFFSPPSAYSTAELPDCPPILMGEIEKIDILQKKLPVVSKDVDDSFSALYKSMGVPEFYKLRHRPHYYLWLLHHDISEAKSQISFYLSDVFADDPHSGLFRIGRVAFLLSNVRNAWTEYAAYSDNVPFSDKDKEQVSYELSQMNIALNVYNSCLAAKVVTRE